ncbi:hypothetical protein BSKO_08379 [Bryopsis sp. KO-2023]|nr:hypothetical protein BSKO_08379 [Bryopsis sp. KO-2023]
MDAEIDASREECVAPLLNTHSNAEVDRIYRKIAWRLLPFAFLMSLVSYVDRSNISLAAVDMSADIGLTKSQFGVASSMFFVTYMIFQIPSNAVLQRVGGPMWLGILLIGWGLAASLTATVRNATELYVYRLLLGVFEAGTFPGLFFYLVQFFPESRTPGVYGITLAGSSTGMGISAPLAAGFLSMNGVLNVKGWQWLFLLEGLLAIVLGVGMMLLLPKSLDSKGFLTRKEQMILNNDGAAQGTPVHGKSKNLLYLLNTVVLNVGLWVLMLCGVLAATMKYVAMFWTPLWIDAMVNGSGLDWAKAEKTGQSDDGVQVALLSTIPYALSAFSSVFFGWTSEKLHDRTIHCFCMWLIGGLFFLLLPWLAGVDVILGFVALMCGHVGVNGTWALFHSLTLSFMTDENKSFGLAWTNSIGNLGGFFGPMVTGFLADQTGSYKSAIWGAGGMTVAAAVVILFVKDTIKKEHKTSQIRPTFHQAKMRR